MSPTDVPPAPSPNAATIIGGNYPGTSETGTAAAVLDLYQRAAESVGTADTAETMHALIEANATGQTPTALIADFTDEQRKAFDRALTQLNQGQTASVMAQDILNTKVQLNGVVMSFDAAVEQLLAAAAAAPNTPENQAELQRRYQELLEAAKQQADTLGSNHRATQEALLSGVEKGVAPEIPSTMATTSPEFPTVPGMPENALGSLLQNVAGQMMKPGSIPNPLQGLSQSVAPLAQTAQQAIGQLMNSLGSLGGDAALPASEDALSVLTKDSRMGDQDAALSEPAAGAGAVGAAGAGAARAGEQSGEKTGEKAGEKAGAEAGEETEAELASGDGESAEFSLGSAPLENLTAPPGSIVESVATAPAETAVTAAPLPSVPTTTLSSADGASGGETLSAARTVTSSGDGAVGSVALSPGLAAPVAAGAAAAGGAPMMPMMPMMGGAAAGAAAATTPSADRGPSGERLAKDYQPDRPQPPPELTDFGSDLKGLAHATDTEMVASSILAALVRTHDRAGVSTEVAVGINATSAVFVTSDGLGFLPPRIRVAGHLTPLITKVPNDFIERWLGCAQPWRPLLEAAALDLVGPFETVVTTDAGASAFGVLSLTPEQIQAVNIAAGSQDRWHFDAIDAEDIEPVLSHLRSVWGHSLSPAGELEPQVQRARWTGDGGPGLYPRRWVRYLIAAATADIAQGDLDDARYVLRSALRIPEPPFGEDIP